MIDGNIVTVSWLLNKVCIILSTIIIVVITLNINPGIWLPLSLCVAVLIRAFIEWRLVNDYMKRLGGDSTWQDPR